MNNRRPFGTLCMYFASSKPGGGGGGNSISDHTGICASFGWFLAENSGKGMYFLNEYFGVGV